MHVDRFDNSDTASDFPGRAKEQNNDTADRDQDRDRNRDPDRENEQARERAK